MDKSYRTKLLFSLFFLFPAFLFAYHQTPVAHPLPCSLRLTADYVNIAKAKFKAPVEGEKFDIHSGFYNLFYVYYFNEKNTLTPGVGYSNFRFGWDENPFFDQKTFQTLQFSLSYLTRSIDDWMWIMGATWIQDLNHFDNWGQYGLFTSVLWGRRYINPAFHLHGGLTGYRGMEGARILPIAGFDWYITRKWVVNAIFPFIYSITYYLDDNWSFMLKGSPFSGRYRAKESEPQPKSVLRYRSFGIDMNIYFRIRNNFAFQIYWGYNLGGDLYIKNRNGKNARYFKFKDAPYIGINGGLAF